MRFKSFIEQYELRELHFHSQMRTKEIELQYHLARHERDKKASDAEMAKVHQLHVQLDSLSRNDAAVRTELHLYIEKLAEACTANWSSLVTRYSLTT